MWTQEELCRLFHEMHQIVKIFDNLLWTEYSELYRESEHVRDTPKQGRSTIHENSY